MIIYLILGIIFLILLTAIFKICEPFEQNVVQNSRSILTSAKQKLNEVNEKSKFLNTNDISNSKLLYWHSTNYETLRFISFKRFFEILSTAKAEDEDLR
jgi:hypothetical protein